MPRERRARSSSVRDATSGALWVCDGWMTLVTNREAGQAGLAASGRRCTKSCPPLLAGFHFPSYLPHSKSDHPFDQRERDRLIERELNRPFCTLIIRQLGAERPDCRRSRIETDVPREGGEMHQVFMQDKRRHPILDHFHGLRCSLPDDRAQFLELRLDVTRETCDVVFNFPGRFIRHNVISAEKVCRLTLSTFTGDRAY